jgi:hypothetical protein
MGQLRLSAIDATWQGGWLGLLLSLALVFRWDFTCGFCKSRVRKVQFRAWSTAVCPFCGTRNLLPVPRFPNDPGPRPPNWPKHQPSSN